MSIVRQFLEKKLQLATLSHSSSKVARSIDLDLKNILPSYSDFKILHESRDRDMDINYFSIGIENISPLPLSILFF